MTEVGRITSVFPDRDDNRIYVSVKVSPSENYEEILFTTGSVGLWMVPTEGDIVEVYNVGRERYHARTPTNPTPFPMPDASEGDFCLRLNENTEIFFQRQDDDTFDLTVKADGDITIAADGNGMKATKDGHIQFKSDTVDFDTSGDKF